MYMRILTLPDDARALRRKAKRVKNLQDPEVIIAIQIMKRLALDWEARNPGLSCEGLAATQIGVPLRIIMTRASDVRSPVNPDFIPNNTEVYITEAEYLVARFEYQEFQRKNPRFDPFRVMINPVFVSSDGMQDSTEGCLSVPGKVGKTIRPNKVIFHYTDESGKRVPELGRREKPGELIAEGFSAACITHEFDHLNGVLFVDSAIEIRDRTPEDKVV